MGTMQAMFVRALFALVCLLLPANAAAGALSVTVVDQNGRPAQDAVVTLHVPGQAPPSQFPWPMQISQREMRFEPFVLVAPAGATVAFPNFDSVRHQVYSFSPAGPFELRLYGRDQTHTVHFRNVGAIAIGCNIHDAMSAFIYVVDTPFAARTAENGVAVLRNLPARPATLRVWHPYMRAPENRIEHEIALTPGDAAQRIQVRLRARPQDGY